MSVSSISELAADGSSDLQASPSGDVALGHACKFMTPWMAPAISSRPFELRLELLHRPVDRAATGCWR